MNKSSISLISFWISFLFANFVAEACACPPPPYFAAISLIQVLVSGDFKSSSFIVSLIVIAIMITIGVLLICIPGAVMFYIAGGLLLVMPVLRIILAEHHYAQFKEELVKLILGTIVIVFGLGSLVDVLFIIFGIVLISLCTLSLVYYILVLVSANKAKKESEPIEASESNNN